MWFSWWRERGGYVRDRAYGPIAVHCRLRGYM